MKKGVLWTGMLVIWASVANAQVNKKKGTGAKIKAATTQVTTAAEHPGRLTQIGQYQARGQAGLTTNKNTFSISDPTIRAFNLRANGSPIELDGKEILGVPKIVYGLGNGQLLLRSRGATTSGTGTGSGMVGTGSSTGPIGMYGLALGVNGKSPYAGPIMDGMIVTDINKERAVTSKRAQRLQLKNNNNE
jgi:hypothetical protein